MDRLANAILLQAVKDWDDVTKRPEIQEFLSSPWFYDLADVAGLDEKQAANIRGKLVTGQYAKTPLRAAHR